MLRPLLSKSVTCRYESHDPPSISHPQETSWEDERECTKKYNTYDDDDANWISHVLIPFMP